MTTTVNLTVTIVDAGGVAVSGAVVYATLSAQDISTADEVIYPLRKSTTANGSGLATLALWPNALGTLNTFYNVEAWNADESVLIFRTTCVLPNAATNLADVWGTTPPATYFTPPAGPPSVTHITQGGTSASTAAGARANLGISATEDVLLVANNLSDVASAATSRTNLGLGTVATLASDTDGTLAANSDTRVATQKATKTYVDTNVTGLLDFKGSTDASSNPNYPAASQGDAYLVSVAGKVGGASGKTVEVGDFYIASANNAGGTEAAVGTNWFVLERSQTGILIAANNLSDVASAATARSNLGLAIGSDVQAYDADTAKLDTVQSWTKAQRGTPAALTSSGNAIAIDMSLGNNFSHTMTENTTLGAPSNMVAGQSGAILITQHASAAKTLAFNAAWVLPSGANGTITTTLSGKSMVLYSTFDTGTVLYDVRNLT